MTTPKIDNEPILIRDVQDGICLLTLNRPKILNAMSTEMLTELQNAFYEIGDDVAIKVVILKGNGSIFCSGHDLKEMRSDPSFDTIHDLFLLCSRMMVTMNNLPQPIIGQAHGIATAAGCQLLVNCDLAFASEEARFATPGVTNGLFCSTPAVALTRNISRKHAMEMLLMGELFDSEDAVRFGLINKAIPFDQLESTVMKYAESIASRSSLTIAIGKKSFYPQLSMELEDAYAHASRIMAENMQERDAIEGIDAFLEKRQPVWQGRQKN